MKKHIFTAGLLALLTVSCTVHEMGTAISPDPDSDPVFYARMEGASEADTKVFADTKLRVLWDENDHVSIFNKRTANLDYRFTGQTGDNAGTFKMAGSAGSGWPLDLIYSVYPYQEETGIGSDGILSVSLPAIQSYRENSFGPGANTMISCTTDNELLFKNLCGYLELRFYGENVSVSSITIRGNEGEPLAGRADVYASADAAPSLSFDNTATQEITLEMESPVLLGTSESEATRFWAVVPPVTFPHGFTVTVKDRNGNVFQKATTKALKIERNTLIHMSALPWNGEGGGTNPDHYVDEYGVDYGPGVTLDGVTWAPVNCGYKPATDQSKGYTYGKLYQWGRKNGQGYGAPYYNSSDPYEDETIPVIQATWDGKNEDADANTFYHGDNSNGYNWIMSGDDFWNDGTEEAPVKNILYDPCPEGWRVPTEAELTALFRGNHSDLTTSNGVWGYWASGSAAYSDNLAEKIFIPAAGSRWADNWFHFNGAIGRGSGVSYWSSAHRYSDGVCGGEWGAASLSNTYKAFGMAVRCCREDSTPTQPSDPTVHVSSISLSQTTLSMTVGESATLVATVLPENATNKNVIWSTDNPSVASVDNGTVSAVGQGTATITAKTEDGDKTAACTVTVINQTIDVTSVSLDKTEITLTEGDSQTLQATVKPDNATDKTVTWTSSDNDIATVDAGTVTAIAEGTATITATAGGKSASCIVTVNKKTIEVTSVTLDKTEITLAPFESQTLVATVKPDNATDKTVTWTSSNSYVASVTEGKVTAILQGTATITATAGGKSATCTVTVRMNTVDVSSVTLDKTEITLIEGDSETLTATVMPDNATDKTVTWTSSNLDVATVDAGTVRAVAEGTATITATAGGISATCSVVVIKQVIDVTSVSLDKTELSLNKGDSWTLAATVWPDNATDKTVTWASSNSGVAKVEGGTVTAVSEGSAVITASAGGKTASCTVTVLGSGPVIKAVYSGIDLSSGGTCSRDGSFWKLSANTRLKVTLKNDSLDTITVTGLSLICSRTNTAYPFTLDSQNLEGGKQFTNTVTLTETLYSPILEFTYQSGGNTFTARTTFTGTFDSSTTEPYPFDPFDPGFD